MFSNSFFGKRTADQTSSGFVTFYSERKSKETSSRYLRDELKILKFLPRVGVDRLSLYAGCYDRCLSGSSQMDTEGLEAGAEEEHVELFTTPTTKMGAATSDFGYNLFRALASRDSSANVFLSPISVSAVLTQLSLGDDTNTQPAKSKLWL